ncbi:MAG: hypothetical protein EBZ77_07615, partial [Chitinophagia bacterium]|nr:hypothetical protein [Chitinophagia bacterium]
DKNELALEYQFKALKLYQATHNKSEIADLLGNVGTTYLLMASKEGVPHRQSTSDTATNLGKAISYFQQVIQMEQDMGDYNALQLFYENLAEAYALDNRYQDAFAYFKRSSEIKDSLFSQENSIKLYNIVRERERDIQKEVDKIKEQNSARERIVYTVGLVLLLLVILLIGMGYRTQKRLNTTISRLVNEQEETIRERTRELAVTNEKLAESNRKLIDLIQFNAHNIREPLTRIMGVVVVKEYMDSEEFETELWPGMKKAVNDLDNIIKAVIARADDAIHENNQHH